MCNSAVRLIFNKKVAEKYNLWDLWTVHECTVHNWLVNNCGLNQKQREREREREREKTRETQNAAVDVESKHIQNTTRLILIGFSRNEEMFSIY